MAAEHLLQMKGIQKSFPGVTALQDVDFEIKRGEVRALMGENGAGKSTLIKILTGIYQTDGGSIVFDGSEVSIPDVQASQKLGISTVYQELNMIPYLNVAENIFLGRYPKNKFGQIDWKFLYGKAKEILDDLGLDINTYSNLENFGTATQQMVSIARAVSMDAKLVVLDEPTSSLDANEVRLLFNIIKRLREKDISVIFITHRLNEVFVISENVTILKDGRLVGTYSTKELDRHQLVAKMVGREVTEERVRGYLKNNTPDYFVEIKNVCKFPKVVNASLGIRRGEIVGIAGLLGSGRTETAEILFGTSRIESGEIYINGKLVSINNPRSAIKHRFAFVTENRREEGIVPDMTVKDNISLSSLRQLSHGIFIDKRRRNEVVNNYISKLKIKTPSMEQFLKFLSGGNQQKTILARWLATNPELIILDEPTRGIDVGSKQEVEKLVNDFAAQGISVLFISSEMAELVRNCDRIYVMCDGVTIGVLEGEEINEDAILDMIASNDLKSDVKRV
jgi:simple sugar transport system ATP-binding protein